MTASNSLPSTPPITHPAKLSSRRSQERINKGVAYVICTIVALAYVFPLYWMVSTALKTDSEIFLVPPSLFPAAPQWQNFLASTQYIPFWQYMLNTLIICALTIVGTVVSCSLIAYGFARVRWPGRNAVFIVYLSTIMLPAQVTMIPLYIVFRQVGWIGTIWPLVVPAFFGNALYVFLLRQFFMTIPNELTDAARIDGANELGIFWRIMLPLLKPALATVALFTFVGTYRDFLGPLIYLTDQDQWTISLGLKMFQNMYGAQWQLMMAAAALTMIPTVILFFLTQRTFIEGIALTGIKA
ncbi:MAG: carbohydrate ABC transporter permease [Caldilinea sp.]|uniref:carbohydrate ABC transporter permease n=1 Tax=Caldilinea sp. TaxID=2293560 RepID=UPI002B58A08F|nr:carbohydrate ABC transporter permease [Anaerolineales bacterium]HQY92523.1 carbohydrate ABC transporter permease [Caldilinea sp.]HRA65689.1 carbohydrate ABC transporter permease [Caldilinea sp.]